jgi:hypothetical protein
MCITIPKSNPNANQRKKEKNMIEEKITSKYVDDEI